jgi:FtsP/CotA-like multicopper oxidase with cupredoxin domain
VPPEGSSFVQVGSDSGLLASPVSHRRLPISPVERFDVVIDFVNLDGGDEVRVIARFGPYSGKYVFHCHNLEHEDMAMMANFEVV